MVAKAFDPERVAVVTGGLELATAFPTLAWDHLLYTGSPHIAKTIMRAAAENLVPVTLELGGKSPAIIADDAVTPRTVRSVMGMKRLKSGQVCVAPDHVFVSRDKMESFVDLCVSQDRDDTPDYASSDDNTGIIAQRHLDRLRRMVAQARNAGCEVIELGGPVTPGNNRRHMPPTLIIDPRPISM